MNRTIVTLLAAGTALTSTLALGQEQAVIVSPDGDIRVEASVSEYGQPQYKIDFRGAPAVEPSKLGLRFKDAAAFDDGMVVAGVKTSSADNTWEQPWGEKRVMRDRHEEMLVTFADAEDDKRRFDVRFRAFDDGVGFRYEVPEQKGLKGRVEITDETTEFAVPEAGTTAFHIPARLWNRYEYLYETTPLSGMHTVHTPVTFALGSGTHLSIHEAALVDYSGMALTLKRGNVLEADLAPWSDGIKVKAEAPFDTPWRTVQIAEDAPGLVNSTMILNLNEPNALGDVSWVEPGKYIGIWWGMHIRTQSWGSGPAHGATTQTAKEYIDFAAEHGFDGVLIEGWNVGWDGDWYSAGEVMDFTTPYDDFDIEEVSSYALSKGVRLIGHHETVGNIANYESQMEEAFDLYERMGVRQVKTGYVADAGELVRKDEKGVEHHEFHDGQFNAQHHIRALKAAAKRKISLNPHEPIKDTGLRRTYPNAISREGARGMEYSAWGVPPNVPEHTAIIPFTRMLSGPMDYTPGIFDLRPNENPKYDRISENDPRARTETTLAKQLALYVVLYSPIQMAADLPENYEEKPEPFQFIKDVPTDWEDSLALAGEVGDYVVIARQERGGEDFYLGAVTDEEGRTVEIPLAFLKPGRRYEAQIYADGENAHWETNPYAMAIEKREVTAEEAMTLDLAPGGGTAIRFRAL